MLVKPETNFPITRAAQSRFLLAVMKNHPVLAFFALSTAALTALSAEKQDIGSLPPPPARASLAERAGAGRPVMLLAQADLAPPASLRVRPDGQREITLKSPVTNQYYGVSRSLDLRSWNFLWRDQQASASTTWTDSVPLNKAFYALAAAPEFVAQTVDAYSWPIAADLVNTNLRGMRFYSHLPANRGEMGGGDEPHALAITNGEAAFTAACGSKGTSWTGMYHSLKDDDTQTASTVNLARPLCAPIKAEFQMPVCGISLRLKGRVGTGECKVELKDASESLLAVWLISIPSTTSFQEVRINIPSPENYPAVKLLNFVVGSPLYVGEDPAHVVLDRIGFVHRTTPALRYDNLLYGFVTCYHGLRHCADDTTGLTQDHGHWPAGHFDSVPATGFQALAAAMAYDLEVVERTDAEQIIRSSIQALINAPKTNGLAPHWLKYGAVHPDSEYSSVDTVLAYWSGLIAAIALDMPAEKAAMQALIDAINWPSITTASNTVTHGFLHDGSINPNAWIHWGGETTLVQLLRWYSDPAAAPWTFNRTPPAYAGRGFITEMGALFFPQLGYAKGTADRFGVDWRQERERQLQLQLAYFAARYPGSVGATNGLNGESCVEIIDEVGTTSYLEGGIGAGGVPANDGGGYLSSHYMMMAASLDPASAARSIAMMRNLGIWQPLTGAPESFRASHIGSAPDRWHSAQISLNNFFSAAGLYHAIKARSGQTDLIYGAAQKDPRLAAALAAMFP